MNSIYVRLLGTPVVLKDEEPVIFPFKKAEALFYYLLVHDQATRDTLVNILWGEAPEKTAKKNLRQAMYKIRKSFDLDIVISPRKAIVMLNPDIKIESDLHDFLKDHRDDINMDQGNFLEGFHVKDGDQFENWMIHYRDQLKDSYLQKIEGRIKRAFSNKDMVDVVLCAKKMIEIDEFNENGYRILMKVYAQEGSYMKGIDTYNRLVKILDEELGVEPDVKTRKCFDDILMMRNADEENRTKKTHDFFYGRMDEIYRLKRYYKDFKEDKQLKSFIIMGEAGVGKTKLKEYFLERVKDQETLLLQANCYQAEEGYLLKPWNEMFAELAGIIKREKIEIPIAWKNSLSKLFPYFNEEGTIHVTEEAGTLKHQMIEENGRFKHQAIEEVMLAVLKKVSQTKKIVLVFEDIQWMDHMSISLLRNVLLHQKSDHIFFIGTCRIGYSGKFDTLITSAISAEKLEKIELSPFTKKQVQEFVSMRLPKYSYSEELHDKIYEETGGNAFFLTEMIKSMQEKGNKEGMSPKMKDILRDRFLDVSDDGKKILSIASLFFDRVNLEMLRLLSHKDLLKILDIVEELQNRGILREVSDGKEISFTFTHQKLREYIYMKQSSARRKIVHNQIALILEKQLHKDKMDRFLYSRLIYHFENGGNCVSALKYKMKNLDVYFNFTHEMFPVLRDGNIEDEYGGYLRQGKGLKKLEEIEKELVEVIKNERSSKEIEELQMNFLHMRGRYLIVEGEYERGICDIKKMIEIALKIKNADYAIKGYMQMIYYGIQTYNTKWMESHIELGLSLAKACNYQKDTGILLRLKGIQKIIDGEYKEAEYLLKQSIKIFENVNEYEEKYTLNMAACYNYIGEIRRFNMRFMGALEYYNRAMILCEEKKVIRGLTIFHTHAGQAAFDMGDHDGAKVYFEKAISLYDEFNSLWGRSTSEGYMSLILIKDGDYKGAHKCFCLAQKYAHKLKSPYELGLLYRVKAEIKVRMKENPALNEVFKNTLTLDTGQYCNRGIEYLRQLKNPYEVEILKAIKKNC